MSRLQLAYLAGVMDSDGTIGVKRSTYSMRVTKDSGQPTYSERIHIRQVERPALELFARIFGGNVRPEPAQGPNRKPLWKWGLTDLKAAGALRTLLPFLRIKRRQAKNCLVLRSLKTKSKRMRVAKGRGHVGCARRSPYMSAAMEECFQIAKRLNKVGV